MKLEELKLKRQLNVNEQILLKKHYIQEKAKFWREKELPEPIKSLLEEYSINSDTCIVLQYDQDLIWGSTDEGLLLTEEGRFYEFDADLTKDKSKLIELYSFIEVTAQYSIKDKVKGCGKTEGFIAMEVLKELNSNKRKEIV